MVVPQFGFMISQPRAVNLDTIDPVVAERILRAQPELQTCIACGSCTATCTAGNLTDFNFRKLHTLVRRGEYAKVYAELGKCMLCGKCRLACPRGINTRGLIIRIKRELGEY